MGWGDPANREKLRIQQGLPRALKRKFRIGLPVQFRDIDVAGHVNHATYLQYMETARVEFLRSIGEMDGIRPRVILASARCEYYRPIIDERRVTVAIWVSRIANRSWDFDYAVESSGGKLFANGRTTQVSYDYEKKSTTRITKDTRKKLEGYAGKPLVFRGKS